MKFEKKKLKNFGDERGNLMPLEFKELNFRPIRMFVVTNVPKECERGNHAHYETEQILFCLQGRIKVKLIYGFQTTILLLKENEYVYVPKMVWDSQIFLTGKDVLLALCSTNYDPDDYIYDFNKYRQLFHSK